MPSVGAAKPPAAVLAQQIADLLKQALAALNSGDLSLAWAACERVRQWQPKQFDALHLAGVIALRRGEPDLAVELITQAIKVDRQQAGAYNSRGAALVELKRFDEAILNYNKALSLQPKLAQAANNRGNCHWQRGELALALADYDLAIALEPGYAEAHNNRGNALSDLGRHAQAQASFEAALQLQPRFVQAQWNLGMCRLRQGDFERGWHDYEARLEYWLQRGWGLPRRAPDWRGPLTNDALRGRTLLVYSEQGLGDSIQFCRYLPALLQTGARVVFEVQASLLTALRPLQDKHGVELVARGQPLPPVDLQCPLMSLPLVMATRAHDVPPSVATIGTDEAAVKAWRDRLHAAGVAHSRRRIGIAWSGSSGHLDDHKRSMALSSWAPLLAKQAVTFVSLQPQVRAADQVFLDTQQQVLQWGVELEDFAQTAALCAALDGVISVDTSVAHLAASMGRPVWMLAAYSGDWRWGTQGSTTPWYPSMRLWRQGSPGDWSGVLAALSAALDDPSELPATGA